ncbi:hypothetical protein CPLU01_02768 [Colletotrichum plurivorum]|uniref:Uncharacterized protein n=1 Tax=Colletotrichum plurivorum TaxID=2175906 RepID=A0A8H6KUH5_9PEZI|nr:hypothetical protein CPLU01_02768 [Colletotrichum plurivorum]
MTAAPQRQCEVNYLRQVNTAILDRERPTCSAVTDDAWSRHTREEQTAFDPENDLCRQITVQYGCWALCGFAGCRPSVRTVELLRTPRGEDAARADLSGRLPPFRLQGAAGEEKILYHPSGTGSMLVSARQGTLSRRWRGLHQLATPSTSHHTRPSSVLLGILSGEVSRGCPNRQRPLLNEYTRNTSSALKSKKTVADDADGYNPEIDPHTESDVRLLKILAGRGNGESGRDSFDSRQGLSDIEQGVLSRRILTKLAQLNLSHTVFSGFARFRRSFSIGPLNLVNGVCCDSQRGQQLPVRSWRPGAGPREHYQTHAAPGLTAHSPHLTVGAISTAFFSSLSSLRGKRAI